MIDNFAVLLNQRLGAACGQCKADYRDALCLQQNQVPLSENPGQTSTRKRAEPTSNSMMQAVQHISNTRRV
jgi:hypothetical protein